eukprot:PhM_4_TR8343/c3_g3_i1/m.17902
MGGVFVCFILVLIFVKKLQFLYFIGIKKEKKKKRSTTKMSHKSAVAQKQLESDFGATAWADFTEKVPNWKKDLAGLDKSTLFSILEKECRFPSSTTAAMATALLEYFSAIPPKKRRQDDTNLSAQLGDDDEFVVL